MLYQSTRHLTFIAISTILLANCGGSSSDDTTELTTDDPTTGADTGTLVINEIVAKDAEGGDDWFEFYNNSDESISLDDYQIIDESDDIDPITLHSVTLLPGEYTVIYATDENPGANYVACKLGNADELSLLFNNKTIDHIDWDDTDVSSGYSYGLFPDGSWTKDTLVPTFNSSNQDLTVFDTNTVESIYIDIEEDEREDLLAYAIDEKYHPASATYKCVTLDEVAIRTKGNSRLTAVAQSGGVRYSFKVDVNEYIDGQKLLGLKKFTLHNSYQDPTYMREYLAYKLMEFMDVPAPQTAFVNLYINNELHGLYLMIEANDGDFLENYYTNSNGDLYKPDGVESDSFWISDNFSDYTDVNLKTNEDTSDNQAFIHFVDEINNDDATRVIDEDSVLRFMSVSTALSNLDSYHNYLQTLIDGPLELTAFEDSVNTTADLIRDYIAVDPTAFYSITEFESALSTNSNEVYGLTSFIIFRTDNVQQQLDGTLATSIS